MKDSLNTLLGAMMALLVLVVLLYQPSTQEGVSRPNSEDQKADGLAGLRLWTSDSGLAVHSLRRDYWELPALEGLPQKGNILVSIMPYARAWEGDDLEQLQAWVEHGNTLLVLAALNDSPLWLRQADDARFIDEVYELTGLYFDAERDEEGEFILLGGGLEAETLFANPELKHPLMRGVDVLESVTLGVSSFWSVAEHDAQRGAVRLAYSEDFGLPTLWEIPSGEGRILFSASASLLSNDLLNEGGNARFFANVVGWHLADKGAVIFDDYRHGLNELYEPQDFFQDSRLYYSLCFVLGFWLLYLLGTGGRLSTPRPPPEPSHQTDLVVATGGLFTRKLGEQGAGRVMIERWLQRLRQSDVLFEAADGAIPWQQIAHLYPAQADALAHVRDAHSRLSRGEKVSLRQLHNTLLKLERSQL
ncbi:MAG: DUF4350 domain-containing protein [Pseudomonadota bacterium]